VNIGNSKASFVLIGGMPRSGTTLIETVIGSHSRIAIPPGDFPFAEQAARGLTVEKIFSLLRKKQTWDLWRIKEFSSVLELDHGAAFRSALALYAEAMGRDIAGAKAPYSEFYLDLYEDWLADHELRFISVIRNPIDVMGSLKHSQIHSNLHGFKDLIEVQCRNWVRSTAIGVARAHAEPSRFCAMRYEDFVRKPAATVSDLCEFIGVDAEEASMLNRPDYAYYATNTSFPDRFAARKDKQTYVYRPESRKADLSAHEIDLIGRICGETARSLGYSDSDLVARPPQTMKNRSLSARMRRLPRRIYRRFSR
jgi:hypothetical protein